MKKALAVIMAAAMTVSLAGCGGSSSTTATTTEAQADTTAVAAESGSGETEAAQGDFKIGIITATVSQSEEEYRAAESVKEKYGDMIIHQTFPDKAASEQETTISIALSMAADPDVKAIICNTAMEGTAAAMEKVKAKRPDILLLAGVPS